MFLDKFRNLPAKTTRVIAAGLVVIVVAGFWGWWTWSSKGKETTKQKRPRITQKKKAPLPPGVVLYTSQGKLWKLSKGEQPEVLLEGAFWFPAVNREGTRMAYWEDHGTTMKLSVMNLVSRKTLEVGEWYTLGSLGRNLNMRNAPCWHPKKDVLYFADGTQIWQVNSDGTDLQTLYEHDAGGCYGVTVSPDLKTFAFVGVTETRQNLWTYSTVSKHARSITDYTSQQGMVGAPAWSPIEGKTIVYALYKAEQVNLWSIPANGGTAVALTKEGRTNSPHWDLLGEKLAVSSGTQNPLSWQIALVNAKDGKFLKQLTNAPAGAFSPSITGAW